MTHKNKVELAIVGVASLLLTPILMTLAPATASLLSIILNFGILVGCLGFIELIWEEINL